MPKLMLLVAPDGGNLSEVVDAVRRSVPGAEWAYVGISDSEWHAIDAGRWRPDDFARQLLAPLWALIVAQRGERAAAAEEAKRQPKPNGAGA